MPSTSSLNALGQTRHTRHPGKLLTLALMLSALSPFCHAIDSASVEVGAGAKTQLLRVALQSNWQAKWFDSNGSALSGYWDTDIASLRGNQYRNVKGAHQSVTDVGFTPVFRWQQNSKQGFYAEGGIGVHFLSGLWDNDGNQLSTHFQFGDHVGVGYVFANKLDLGLKLQHFSNGGYKKPNTGINYVVVKAGMAF